MKSSVALSGRVASGTWQLWSRGHANDAGRLNHLMIKCTDRAAVVSHMNQRVYVHPRDANGRRLAPVRSNGLVNRRRVETAPFRRQPGAQ